VKATTNQPVKMFFFREVCPTKNPSFFSLEDDGSLEVVGAVAATSTSNLEAVKFQASKLGENDGFFFRFFSHSFFQYGVVQSSTDNPPQRQQLATENAWLEDDPFLLVRLIFRAELSVLGRVDHLGPATWRITPLSR